RRKRRRRGPTDSRALRPSGPLDALVRLLQPRQRARRREHGGVHEVRDAEAPLVSVETRSAPGSAVYPTSPFGENDPRIPPGRDVEWEPLVDYRRHGVSETTIHGAVAWASGGRLVHSFGGNVLCYGRSMM